MGPIEDKRDIVVEAETPLGRIYSLCFDVWNGMIDEDVAIREVTQDRAYNLSVQDIDLVAGTVLLDEWRNPGHGITLSRLILVAADITFGRSVGSPWWTAAAAFTATTREYLQLFPDGRRLWDATVVVDQMIALSGGNPPRTGGRDQESSSLQNDQAVLLLAKATLLAAPLIQALWKFDARGAILRWVDREYASQSGPSRSLPDEKIEMPRPMELLSSSFQYAQSARDISSDVVLFECLMHIMELLMLLRIIDPTHDQAYRAEYADCAREASKLLRFAEPRAGLIDVVEFTNTEDGVRTDIRVAATPIAMASNTSTELVLKFFLRLMRTSPDVVDLHETWRECESLASEEDGDPFLPELFAAGALHCIPGNRLACPGPQFTSDDAARQLQDYLEKSSHVAEPESAATIIHLVSHLPAGRENDAIQTLNYVEEHYIDFSVKFRSILDYLRVSLVFRMGRRLAENGEHHWKSFNAYLELGKEIQFVSAITVTDLLFNVMLGLSQRLDVEAALDQPTDLIVQHTAGFALALAIHGDLAGACVGTEKGAPDLGE